MGPLALIYLTCAGLPVSQPSGSPHVWPDQGGYVFYQSGLRRRPEMIFLLALLVILIVAGAGFALHLLWWVAIAALIVWALGFLFRR